MPVTINGTTGIAGANGSASTPAVQGEDTNTGVFFPAADTVAVATGGSERMRVDSSGNLGVGTTSPLSVSGYTVQTINNATSGAITYYQQGGTTVGRVVATSSDFYVGGVKAGSNLIFESAGSEGARIDSSGNLLVGATSVLAANRRLQVDGGALIACLFKNSASANEVINVWNSATSGNNVFVQWQTEAGGSARGTITYNRAGGLVAYNTTSDYRAKDIAGAIFGASDTVLNLKPYMGTMKGATIERPMFIAHETQEIAPYAVVGEKDAVDNDGNPIYQQMDHSALVPLLTAALQEALTEIASMKARITALEAN
jgi:hypothetical protein